MIVYLVEERKNITHTLTEARLESETLELEKKQLMQNWNSCLIGIRRRDEAQATMNEAVRYDKTFERMISSEKLSFGQITISTY